MDGASNLASSVRKNAKDKPVSGMAPLSKEKQIDYMSNTSCLKVSSQHKAQNLAQDG